MTNIIYKNFVKGIFQGDQRYKCLPFYLSKITQIFIKDEVLFYCSFPGMYNFLSKKPHVIIPCERVLSVSQ